jgi:hypothetical protein
MNNQHDLSDKFFSVYHAPLPLCIKFESRLQPSSSELVSQLDALHTQNFEIQVPKGSHLREVLLFRLKTCFHGLKTV